jgi:hypothetical protein
LSRSDNLRKRANARFLAIDVQQQFRATRLGHC